MKQSTKNNLLIFGSVVALGAVAFYLYKRNKKNVPEGVVTPSEPSTDKQATPSEPKNKTIAPKTPSVKEYLFDTPTTMSFQDWMDATHPNWVNGKNLNKGSGYGNVGPSTKSAWSKYGNEYVKVLDGKYNESMKVFSAQEMKRRFPVNKSLVALVDFRAFAVEKRGLKYYNTDSNGNTLPSQVFKATASVGSVVGYDGNTLLVKPKEPIKPENQPAGGISRVYNLIRIKPTWVE